MLTSRTSFTIRRLLTVSVAALALAVPVIINAAPADASGRPLRAAAARHHLPVGTAVSEGALGTDRSYTKIIGREFSSITAESSMKWKNIEAVEGVRDYSKADRIVDYARSHDQRVWGHTLVWWNGTPAWLNEGVAAGEYTPDELRALLKAHITDQVQHFGSDVWAWDVINEALNDDGTLRSNIWLDNLGESYLADAFRWAHQANPKAKLIINDYNIEWVGSKSTAMLDLVTRLRAEGVPVDGVGFQTHRRGVLPADYAANLQRFTDAGFDVAITEMDKRIPLPVTEAGLQEQANDYAGAMRACLAMPRCISFSTWGFTDKYNYNSQGPDVGAAALADENFVWKPAYYAVRDVLIKTRPAHPGTGRDQ